MGGSSQTSGGIHARLGYSEGGGLRIVETPEGGAAAQSGLEVGDKIIGIDGAPVRNLNYVEVVERLRGPAGSQVQLEIVRDGRAQTHTVTRQPYRTR
jgi:carboxyl-terminal processing protease